MTTPTDQPTPGETPNDPGAPTVVTPVDPTTGYAVPVAEAPGAGPDVAPAATGYAPPQWGAATPPPPAPPAPVRGWYRQPWGVAGIVVAGIAALLLSFGAGFATHSAIDRTVGIDRVADRVHNGDTQRGPGMDDQQGYGNGPNRSGDQDGDQDGGMPGRGPGGMPGDDRDGDQGTAPVAPQAPGPQVPAPANPAPQSSS
jgi:hypothetical protein